MAEIKVNPLIYRAGLVGPDGGQLLPPESWKEEKMRLVLPSAGGKHPAHSRLFFWLFRRMSDICSWFCYVITGLRGCDDLGKGLINRFF